MLERLGAWGVEALGYRGVGKAAGCLISLVHLVPELGAAVVRPPLVNFDITPWYNSGRRLLRLVEERTALLRKVESSNAK